MVSQTYRKFYDIEYQGLIANNKKFRELMDYFYDVIGVNLDDKILQEFNSREIVEMFFYLKVLVHGEYRKYLDVFYDILSNSGYDLQKEMI